MGARRKGEPPAYRKWKRRGQRVGYATNDGGRVVFPGAYGSRESRAAYEEWRRDWIRLNPADRPASVPSGCEVGDLIETFLVHATEYYRRPDGTPTDEPRNFRMSLKLLRRLYEDMPANDFKPTDLRAVRDEMIRAGLSKGVINQRIGRIRRVFRWGVSEGIVKGDVLTDLERLADLPKGRGAVRETKRVLPVAWDLVRRTLPHLTSDALRSLVMLQWWTGCRPGQACGIRGEDVFRGGVVLLGRKALRVPEGCWLWVIDAKMAHLRADEDKAEVYPLNVKARAVLKRWARPAGLLFPTDRSDRYLVTSYGRAIWFACERAGVPHWHPHQLRHSAYVRLQMLGGSHAAGLCLNHRADLSQIYGQKDVERASFYLAKLPLQLG